MTNGIYLKEMGKKIKAARKAQGITLRQLGVICELDYGSISRIESGQKNSYLLTLKTIADALKMDVQDFL